MWCVGFREIRWVQPERDGKGPLPPRVRVTIEHGLECVRQILRGRPMVYLPEPTGAGPCGTVIVPGMAPPGAALAWSMQHLLPKLQAWYAARNVKRDPASRAGLTLGARSGGGNGRPALW